MAYSFRSSISILIIAIFFVIVFFKLLFLQIVEGDKYKRISQNNFLREAIIPSPRGTIYDRNGVKISYSRPMVNLYIKNSSKEKGLQLISKLKNNNINLNKIDLDNIFDKNNNSFLRQRILIKKDLSIEDIYIIDTKFSSYENIELISDYLRVYPYNEIGSHLVGHLTANDKKDVTYGNLLSNRKGAVGIEWDQDDELSGTVGAEYFFVDSRGDEVSFENLNYNYAEIEKGKDIHTTIDIELQRIIYRSFDKLNGAVMVSNVNSGEVLSLVSKPGFDPNLFSKPISSKQWKKLKDSPDKPFLNRAFLVSNPPGSIIKIVTAVAGLEEKKVSKDTTFYCPGSTKIGNREFRCWLRGGHGNVNVSKALITSCDVYFYKLGLRLGINKFSDWLSKFGVGELHEDFPFKQRLGTIPSKNFINKYLDGNFYNGDLANVSIGQGYLTLNVLQAHKIISIIANNGEFVKFRLYKNQEIIKDKLLEIDEKNLQEIKKGLVGVVNDREGTGFQARVDDKVAGKTGTAQVISKDSKKYGYGKFKNHGWFTAYYPSDKPEIAITVFAEHGDSGGSAGGPIIKQIISYYKKNYLENNDQL